MNAGRKTLLAVITGCFMTLAITACDRQESPEKTRADVEKAQINGAKEVDKARQDAAESTVGAQKDLGNAAVELGHESAEAHKNVTLAEADANNKIAIEKCEAMEGDLRAACKKQADANLDSAKAYAKAHEVAVDPKP